MNNRSNTRPSSSTDAKLLSALQRAMTNPANQQLGMTTTDQVCAAAFLGDDNLVQLLLTSGASINHCSMVSKHCNNITLYERFDLGASLTLLLPTFITSFQGGLDCVARSGQWPPPQNSWTAAVQRGWSHRCIHHRKDSSWISHWFRWREIGTSPASVHWKQIEQEIARGRTTSCCPLCFGKCDREIAQRVGSTQRNIECHDAC